MKNIVITECDTGFGFNAAKYLAEQGHKVYAIMKNTTTTNTEAAKILSDFATTKNRNLNVVDLDVTSDQSLADIIKQIEHVDVFINNCGKDYEEPTEALSEGVYDAELDFNVIGNVPILNAISPMMRANKSGLFIQLISVGGRLTVMDLAFIKPANGP